MKVVIDTNVFISSFFGGNPRRIIDGWKNGDLTLCLSRPINDEYVQVLQRMGLDNQPELEEILALFARGINCLFTAKTPTLRVVVDDPDDDKFIECAVALKAKAIISGDKALTAIRDYLGIKILSPRDFLDSFPSLPQP